MIRGDDVFRQVIQTGLHHKYLFVPTLHSFCVVLVHSLIHTLSQVLQFCKTCCCALSLFLSHSCILCLSLSLSILLTLFLIVTLSPSHSFRHSSSLSATFHFLCRSSQSMNMIYCLSLSASSWSSRITATIAQQPGPSQTAG